MNWDRVFHTMSAVSDKLTVGAEWLYRYGLTIGVVVVCLSIAVG